MTAVACPACGYVTHPTVVAGSRFKRTIDGYRDAKGGPTRTTRAEAERDVCDRRVAARDPWTEADWHAEQTRGHGQ